MHLFGWGIHFLKKVAWKKLGFYANSVDVRLLAV